jgi:hypothetical protein
MEQGVVKRSGRGRPRLRPKRVVGDKGYTGRRIRSYLREVSVLPSHDCQMNPVEVFLVVKSTVNVTLLNVRSTDSNNFVGSQLDMRSWLQIIQP